MWQLSQLIINWKAVIRFALIVSLGAVPATYYGWWAGPMALMGTVFAGIDIGAGLTFFGWGIATIAGTVSLWVASIKRVNTKIAIGLILGMIAIAPFTFHTLMREPTMNSAYGQFAFTSPFFVAGYLLLEDMILRRRRALGPLDTNENVPK